MTQREIKNTLLRSVALSVRQPWCWAILHGGKDVENRDWSRSNPGLKFRGRALLHSSMRFDKDDVESIRDIVAALGRDPGGVPDPRPDLAPDHPEQPYPTGGIVGAMNVTDVVHRSASPWFFGPYGLVLANAQPLPFRPFKGRLGFFPVPDQET